MITKLSALFASAALLAIVVAAPAAMAGDIYQIGLVLNGQFAEVGTQYAGVSQQVGSAYGAADVKGTALNAANVFSAEQDITNTGCGCNVGDIVNGLGLLNIQIADDFTSQTAQVTQTVNAYGAATVNGTALNAANVASTLLTITNGPTP